MTHCEVSVRSARDEMRHIIGSSKPEMSSLGLTKIRTGDARRIRTTWNSCANGAKRKQRGGVAKIMAMPGTTTAVADLCLFLLVACDDGGLGFVNASVRTITSARQVGVRLRSKCTTDMLRSKRTTQSRKENKQEDGYEHMREDKQELENRGGKQKMQRGYAGLFSKTTRTKD